MEKIRVLSGLVLVCWSLHFPAFAVGPASGFFLPDSMQSMTLTYRMVKDLIVLPVTINDSVNVNLILDTGCRNLVVFGKRLKNLFSISSSRRVEFSGLGEGKPVSGVLSIGNKVSINHVLGEKIPVVVVDNHVIFDGYHKIDGVIGYEIFLKFEIELNPAMRSITFRPAQNMSAPYGYTKVPLHVSDARPVLASVLYLRGMPRKLDVMIDTGSSLGLLLKTTDISEFSQNREAKILGIGLNGPVTGYRMISEKLKIDGLELRRVQTGIVSSPWHNNASIGMDLLKDYVVILNYCKGYACFKRSDA